MRAARSIAGAKIRSGDSTPWRELIRLFRLGDPVRVEVEVVDIDGQQRVQTIIAERGFGLKGDDALMFNAISELSDALTKIESFEPDQYVSHGVENHVLIKRQKMVGALGGRPASDDATPEKIGTWLKNRGYVESLNKKELVIEAMKHFKVGKTKVTDAVTREGLAREKKGRDTRK